LTRLLRDLSKGWSQQSYASGNQWEGDFHEWSKWIIQLASGSAIWVYNVVGWAAPPRLCWQV